jgi:hypothetical protein
MYRLISPENNVAIVDVITETNYVVRSFASEDAFRNCAAPLATVTLPGSPNSTDMLAAFPGYVDASDEPLPLLSNVPKSVSARQIRLWLVQHGISLAAVQSAIDAIPDLLQRDIVQIEWEYAPYVERAHPMLIPLAQALGLTEEQVDQAFREAAGI